jgi:hypothetical protein
MRKRVVGAAGSVACMTLLLTAETSANPCLARQACPSPGLRPGLTVLATQHWDAATAQQRELFARVAPMVFTDQQIVAMFNGYRRAGAAQIGTLAAASSSCHDEVRAIPCDAAALGAPFVGVAATSGVLSAGRLPAATKKKLFVRCKIRDTWDSNQFISGRHKGKYDNRSSTDFTCADWIGRLQYRRGGASACRRRI